MDQEYGAESLTVRELVHESGLGVTAMTGEIGLDRAVKGIHFSELRDPVHWMVGESVLVCTGQAFANDVRAGLWLLERLMTIDTAALAVATGHYIDTIPSEMIHRAAELRLPLLEIPFGVRTRTLFAYVYNALASSDLHRLRRTVATQNHLLDLLVADSEVDELIAKVAALIEMPIVLLDSRGRMVTCSGDGALAMLAEHFWRCWSSPTKSSGPMGVVEAGQERFYYRDVVLYGKVERVIAASSPRAPSSEFADMSLSFLQRLVALDLLKRRDELVAARRMRQALLRDFLAAAVGSEEMTQWIAEQGIDLRKPWRVALCQNDAAPGTGLRGNELEDALMEIIDVFFSSRGIPFLGRPRRSSIAVLFPDTPQIPDGAGPLLGELHRFAAGDPYLLRLRVGCSATHDDPEAGRRALQEALDAASAAERGISSEGIVLFEEMSGKFRLLSGQSEEALLDIARRTVAPLIEHDARRHTRLLLTLRSLFANRLAVQPTAKELFIHRNSLQKRLRRIETLLDKDFTDLDDVMELYLGLRATELLGEARIAEGAPAMKGTR